MLLRMELSVVLIITLLMSSSVDQSKALEGEHVCTTKKVEHVQVQETIDVQQTRKVECKGRRCKDKMKTEIVTVPMTVTHNRTITHIQMECCHGYIEHNSSCVKIAKESKTADNVVMGMDMEMRMIGVPLLVLLIMFVASAVIVYLLYSKDNKCSRFIRVVKDRRSSSTSSVVAVLKARRKRQKKGKEWAFDSPSYVNVQKDPISVSSVNRYEILNDEAKQSEHIYEVIITHH